jgi:fused signal recognition particle receptor
MGLFDKFRKRVKDAVSEADMESLSAEEGSEEATKALAQREESKTNHEAISTTDQEKTITEENIDLKDEDDWEDEDDWDDADQASDLSQQPILELTKKQKKMLDRQSRKIKRSTDKQNKEMKRRGAVSLKRAAGSKVDLQMMRTTTGRQLIEVKATPKGSTGTKKTDSGIKIDLGGGVVENGGRVIKSSKVLDELLEELEWILLESDVSSEAVSEVMSALETELIGQRLRKGANLSKVIEASLKRALTHLLDSGYWDFDRTIQSYIDNKDLPVVIMFVGVNGTGKTTTVAKIAHRLKKSGHSVIAAAGDTFRAGAIEQLEIHCQRLNVRCISSQRGGDSAAITRDAIESAKAKAIDVVLVDTAGRMQNKVNLMNELEKVRRVANPHLTLFIGDALAGNDVVDQAKAFQEILKFDGAILTKMDTDAKGGAGLSIAFATGRPIVMVGVGQEYDDLQQFEPNWLLDEMFI